MQERTGPWWPVWAGAVWILTLRLAGLSSFPRIEADEGGWPMAVRLWLETGPTFDYYMAPGYHWLLGVPFALFGANLAVARAVSAVLGLAGLYLFFRLARALAGSQTAWWSVLLLGTCQAAVLVDRRALIEPFQIALMLALCVTVVERGRYWQWIAPPLCALLLLTKISAIFLLPALVLAALWPGPVSRSWRDALRVAILLGLGLALTGVVFYWLHRQDPVLFARGWQSDFSYANVAVDGTMGQTSYQAVQPNGRFALNPLSTEVTLRYFGMLDPLLLGLAVAGLCRALLAGRHALMILWLVLGGAFLAVQLYVQGNHRAMLNAPICFLAAWMLAECDRDAPERRRWLGCDVTWPRLCLVLVAAVSTVRLAGAGLRLPDRETGAARWLAAHGGPQTSIMAPWYVTIQIDRRIKPNTFFNLPKPYLPHPGALAAAGAPAWLVVDDREWLFHARQAGATSEQIAKALDDCCELAFTAPGARVYRVRR